MIEVMLCLPVGGSRGGRRAWVLIDSTDKPRFDEKRWWITKRGYVMGQAGAKDRGIFLHRWLLGLMPGDRREVDHRNRRTFDNRRSNLRLVNRRQNCGNTSSRQGGGSRHRGVRWRSDRRKWEARVGIARHLHYVGQFDTEMEAAEAARNYRLAHLPGAVD